MSAPAPAVLLAPVDLDVASSEAFSAAVEQAFAASPPAVALDLRDVRFCDSTGLRVLVRAAKRSRSSGTPLELRHVPETVQRLADLAGLSSVLEAGPHAPGS